MSIQSREEVELIYPYPIPPGIQTPLTLTVKVGVSIDSEAARRLVNIQLMLKFGQLIVTDEPEIFIDKQDIYWKVPLRVVSPEGDDNKYLLNQHAFVDAITGKYEMDEQFLEALRAEARPILQQLYPDSKPGSD
jgi:hypothetical protein